MNMERFAYEYLRIFTNRNNKLLSPGPDILQEGSQTEVHRCEAGELWDGVRHRLLVQNVQREN